jgi:hypothetical protein
MAKKTTDKEAPETSPEKKPAKKAAASAKSGSTATAVNDELKPAKSRTSKKAVSEEAKPAKTTRSRKAAAAPTDEAPVVIEEQIRITAYYRWVERGMSDGGHEEDWIEAEKQIKG